MDIFFNTYYYDLVGYELLSSNFNIFMLFVIAGITLGAYKPKSNRRYRITWSALLLVSILIPIVYSASVFLYTKALNSEEIKNEICSKGTKGIDINIFTQTFDKVPQKDRPEMKGLSLGEIMQLYCTGIIVNQEATPVIELGNGAVIFSKEDLMIIE